MSAKKWIITHNCLFNHMKRFGLCSCVFGFFSSFIWSYTLVAFVAPLALDTVICPLQTQPSLALRYDSVLDSALLLLTATRELVSLAAIFISVLFAFYFSFGYFALTFAIRKSLTLYLLLLFGWVWIFFASVFRVSRQYKRDEGKWPYIHYAVHRAHCDCTLDNFVSS